ncbi:MAG: hypothetical protein A2X61_10585 [Ignavibacteria bacterium GWB2_35_12]|nr:MAG: hypothetical protein A2X61_10585 [Ignavibacteria bacterium GWB2_35_12]
MNNSKKYFKLKMKDTSFKKAYLEEKTKLDLEFLVDELYNDIKLDKPSNELIKGVRKIKHVLEKA